ncbi:MAG: ClpXP protease specificity-enhancing factor SspB, partial [Alphaproteobacteria bacterium]|nr:ClpXP protease specificity-enhancing factor SspB [Alphaproteobacteria bacterium]
FWNLSVGDDEFSVVLSFGKTPAAITIPYHAITQFSDPATNFTLRFDRRGDDAPADNKKQQATDVKNNNPTAQKPIAEQEDMPLTDNPTTDNNNGDSNVISLADFRKNQQTSS